METQMFGKQRTTPGTTQTEMTPKDLSFFSDPDQDRQWEKSLKATDTCPSPADVNKTTLQSSPATCSEMPQCQEESWAVTSAAQALLPTV